ncbi:MAG: Sugar fermentation stimulation protein A [Planctomycetes bacterium]|nr:Sugar fermentation stimulation protein A [Planctomycetota bacterium]
MRIAGPVAEGTLVRRYKRFLADVEVGGALLTVHVPNSGSMAGLSEPGMPVLVSDSGDPSRKLRWTLERVRAGRAWVGVNTMLPNRIVREGIVEGLAPELGGYATARPEVVCGPGSRIDLLLEGGAGPRAWVEVKNTTLLDGSATSGVVRFPDAVTERGRKHLGELVRLRRAGDRAVIFFLVNRPDGAAMGPADAIDPAYGDALRAAAAAGVELVARRAVMRGPSVRLGAPVPILL